MVIAVGLTQARTHHNFGLFTNIWVRQQPLTVCCSAVILKMCGLWYLLFSSPGVWLKLLVLLSVEALRMHTHIIKVR